MNIFSHPPRSISTLGAAIILLNSLQGCAYIRDVNAGSKEGSKIQLFKEAEILIRGGGLNGKGAFCDQLTVDFGDGESFSAYNVFLGVIPNMPPPAYEASLRVPHTYAHWPGKKRIHVTGSKSCIGDVETTVTVFSGAVEFFGVAFANQFGDGTPACSRVSNSPLRKGSGVRIVTVPLVPEQPLNYCDNGHGCPHDPAGELGSNAPSSFPIPGFRKYSLVYRVGSQLIQAESSKTLFIAAQTAPLEVCVNDDFRSDNSGGMVLQISVNEMSAE